MKLKMLMTILLSFFCASMLTSQDTKEEIKNLGNKAIEFSIGGGFSTNSVFYGSYERITDYADTIDEEIKIEYRKLSIYGFDFIFSLPLSFVFYPKKYFGIGINNTFGFNICLFGDSLIGVFDILNRIKVINKIGSIDKNMHLVLEYGISFIGRIYAIEVMNSLASGIEIDTDDVSSFFYFGPCIAVGYEKIFKNGFSFSVLSTFEADFRYTKSTSHAFFSNRNTVYEYVYSYLRPGLEFRFRFSYFKYIN